LYLIKHMMSHTWPGEVELRSDILAREGSEGLFALAAAANVAHKLHAYLSSHQNQCVTLAFT
jgi:hypothetical protein